MPNVVRFPGCGAQEEAARWVARLDRGLSDAERDELGRWLAADGARRDRLLELARVWDGLDELCELAAVFPIEPARRADPVRAPVPSGGGANAERPLRGQRNRPSRAALWATAAGLACVAAALGFGAWPRAPASIEAPAATVSTVARYRTPVGKRSERRLPDGSLVRLNTDTEIDVAYAPDRRVVTLRRGEAHFEVAPDPARPFVVRAGGRVVQAVGTAFNVRFRNAGDVEVIVTEGRVRIGSLASTAGTADSPRAPLDDTLLEGDAALLPLRFAADTPPRVVHMTPEDIDVRLAWQRGVLIFRGVPLADVLAEFSRYTTVELVLESRELGAERVGATLTPGRIEDLLGLLRDNLGIEAERQEGRIVLRGAPR